MIFSGNAIIKGHFISFPVLHSYILEWRTVQQKLKVIF